MESMYLKKALWTLLIENSNYNLIKILILSRKSHKNLICNAVNKGAWLGKMDVYDNTC